MSDQHHTVGGQPSIETVPEPSEHASEHRSTTTKGPKIKKRNTNSSLSRSTVSKGKQATKQLNRKKSGSSMMKKK